jgi:cell division protein FtsB
MITSRSRPVFTWIAIAACLPLGILLAIAFARVALADYEIHQQKQGLERRIAQLKDENARLGERASYLKTDTGIELLAREQLGWVRPGDTAIVIVRDQAQDVRVATAGAPTLSPPVH